MYQFQQQQPLFQTQGSVGYPQQTTVKEVNDFYQDLAIYHSYLEKTKDNTKIEIKSTDERIELSKKQLKEACGKKIQSQKTVAQSDPPLMDWVENEVKFSISSSIKASQDKNKEILFTLLSVHQMMEIYSQQNHKLQKNTSKELQLLKELENIREQLQSQELKLQELSTNFEFKEVDHQLGQIRKNYRVKEFDEQSYDLLKKLKNDYYHSKIILDKNKEQMENIKKTLDDGK